MSRLDCEEAMALLHDYLKREITPDLAEQVQGHLERCLDCLSHARFEENFLSMLQTRAGRGTCPDKVRARILALLRVEARGG